MITERRNALERIESVEKMVPNLIKAVGKQFDELNEKVKAMEEVLDAVVGSVGIDAVTAALIESRRKRSIDEAEAQKKETAALVEQGILVPQETIDEESVVIASEVKADGSPVGSGWFRFQMQEIKEEFRNALMGQSKGFSGTFENGNNYSVLEVYKVDQAKAVTSVQHENPTAEA